MVSLLKVGATSQPLAPDSVMEGLFATITLNLERGAARGSRFPNVIEHLSWRPLKPAEAAGAVRELREIEEGLRKTAIAAIVWTQTSEGRRGDDPAQPVNHQAANAYEYFVDADGRPLIARLLAAAEESAASGQPLRIETPGDQRKLAMVCGAFAALGAGWMWLGRAWFPHLMLTKGYMRNGGGLPVWTFGMDLVMLGLGFWVIGRFPSVGAWLFARPVIMIGLVCGAVIGWLVVCAYAGFLR